MGWAGSCSRCPTRSRRGFWPSWYGPDSGSGMLLSKPVLTANHPKGAEPALVSESRGGRRGLRRQRSRRITRGAQAVDFQGRGVGVAGEACHLGKVSDDAPWASRGNATEPGGGALGSKVPRGAGKLRPQICLQTHVDPSTHQVLLEQLRVQAWWPWVSVSL